MNEACDAVCEFVSAIDGYLSTHDGDTQGLGQFIYDLWDARDHEIRAVVEPITQAIREA